MLFILTSDQWIGFGLSYNADSITMIVVLSGDLNGDGFVGLSDLDAVLGHWNTGTPPQVSAVIPEPAGLGLMMLGSCGLWNRRVQG